MKKLFFVFLLLTCACGFALYYYWQQVTKLPDWYSSQASSAGDTSEASNLSEFEDARAKLNSKIEASLAMQADAASGDSPNSSLNSKEQHLKKNVEIELSEMEVNDLVTTAITKQSNRSKVMDIPIVRTNIKEGILESGTVVNLSELSKNKLLTSQTAFLEKAIKTFPFLENRKIYVGISGQPRIEDGKLKFDRNTQIKLGELSLSLEELAQRLNVPKEQLEQKFNRALQLGKLKISDLELTDNKIKLKGSVNGFSH